MRRSNADRHAARSSLEVRAVAVFVRVLELVERVVFRVEELAVAAEEVVVDSAADGDSRRPVRLVVRLGHLHPLALGRPYTGAVRSR